MPVSSTSTPSILFVCLGNICRSPLAEAALRLAADAVGLAFAADSAGTGDWHIGDPPDRRAIAVAKNHGTDISKLRGRQIGEDDFYRFDHIFALDQANLEVLRAIAPEDRKAEICLLMDVVPGREGNDVLDPYYGKNSGFETTWEDVSAAAAAIVKRYGLTTNA